MLVGFDWFCGGGVGFVSVFTAVCPCTNVLVSLGVVDASVTNGAYVCPCISWVRARTAKEMTLLSRSGTSRLDNPGSRLAADALMPPDGAGSRTGGSYRELRPKHRVPGFTGRAEATF